MTVAAYRSALRRTDAPRALERRILLESASRLEPHRGAYDGDAARAARLALLSGGLRDALWENQTCWRALRQDVSDAGNGLPPDLRAAFVSLAIWVDRQTSEVLGGRGRVAPLIDLNRTVAAGLGRAADDADRCP